jgi:hypothetical protein
LLSYKSGYEAMTGVSHDYIKSIGDLINFDVRLMRVQGRIARVLDYRFKKEEKRC